MNITNVTLTRTANEDKGTYSHQYNLQVSVRWPKNGSLSGTIKFCNGVFYTCDYSAPGKYDFDVWMFVGGISALIKEITDEYSYRNRPVKPKGATREISEEIAHITRACPNAFEL